MEGNSDEKSEALLVAGSPIAPTIKSVNDAPNGDNNHERASKLETKVYKWRWIVLTLFMFYSAVSTFQWIEYSIITNVVTRYYGVSAVAVNWTSMTYMLYYILLIIPASYAAELMGLRWTTIAGCFLCTAGSWIKVFSVHPDKFILLFVGQSLVASTQVFVLTTPGRLSAHWFHTDQLSTATSLGIFGNQLGVAFSFFLMPILVKNYPSLDDIGIDISRVSWTVAVVSTISMILVIFFFPEQPRLPPSTTRAIQLASHGENKEGFLQPMRRLFSNKSYLILCNSYGLNVGVLNTVGTLLNQIYLYHFENGEEEAGRLGLAIIAAGMLGSVTFGIILDKTKKFKCTTVTVYLFTLVGQIMFAVAIWCEVKWMVYVAATFLGIFMTGYMALGYEMCAEYTYPESESMATGILNVANNVYSIILVLISGILMETYGDFGVHACLCGSLLLGLVLTIMTDDETRRQDARVDTLYSSVSAKDETFVSDSKIPDKRSIP